jgi:hypothetical protein
LFQVCSALYERVAVIITTNLRFAEWSTIMGGDERMSAALLDRLTRHLRRSSNLWEPPTGFANNFSISNSRVSRYLSQRREKRKKPEPFFVDGGPLFD